MPGRRDAADRPSSPRCRAGSRWPAADRAAACAGCREAAAPRRAADQRSRRGRDAPKWLTRGATRASIDGVRALAAASDELARDAARVLPRRREGAGPTGSAGCSTIRTGARSGTITWRACQRLLHRAGRVTRGWPVIGSTCPTTSPRHRNGCSPSSPRSTTGSPPAGRAVGSSTPSCSGWPEVRGGRRAAAHPPTWTSSSPASSARSCARSWRPMGGVVGPPGRHRHRCRAPSRRSGPARCCPTPVGLSTGTPYGPTAPRSRAAWPCLPAPGAAHLGSWPPRWSGGNVLLADRCAPSAPAVDQALATGAPDRDAPPGRAAGPHAAGRPANGRLGPAAVRSVALHAARRRRALRRAARPAGRRRAEWAA